MTQALWQPTPEQIAQAQITQFMQQLNHTYDIDLQDYASLHTWSTENPAAFWQEVAEFCHVDFATPYKTAYVPGDRMIDTRWFVGGRLNFAENLLKFRDDHIALITYNERDQRRTISYAQLYQQVAQCAQALQTQGVVPGDVVAGLMPNTAETIIAMLATTSLGAIWTACSPDFGQAGVLDRFSQVSPKILFACDGYTFKGKAIDCLSQVQTLQQQLPSLTQTIIVPFLKTEPDINTLRHTVRWPDLLVAQNADKIPFAHLPFNHPLYILYSSGTTGLPKCIVHGVGGTLLQHLKELVLHTDLTRQDTLCYYTTCSWMMWHWMVSGLATGCTLLLYEGAPLYPDASRLWAILAKEKVTVFGTSAKYLSAVDKAGIQPGKTFDLTALRTLLSTGSPLMAQEYDFVYQHIKRDLCLASISGGTDIISCFALGCPIKPVYAQELQCLGLGMQVEIFNADGKPVIDEAGELVCTQAFPSMPVFFWHDPHNHRYLQAYFEKFPGVWAHGDYAKRTGHDGLIIYGRSDATLNPGGVRIGSAEIYRPVESIDTVLESLAVGQPWQGDSRIILFVVLRPGHQLDADLSQQIRAAIRAQASPRHVPALIIQVTDLPRTVNGKLSEIAVKQTIMNEPVANTHALANPEALDQFKNMPQLQ